MAEYARWQRTITDTFGNIQPGATILVEREEPGFPAEPLFTDRAGLTPLANPFAADVDGFAAFYCKGGAFRITATSGAGTQVWRHEGIGTAGEADKDTLLGDAQALIVVPTRTALKLLDSTIITSAYLKEGDRAGIFVFIEDDFSAEVALDTQEGVYIEADAIPATTGAWVRQFEGPLYAEWFGAQGVLPLVGLVDNLVPITCALAVGGSGCRVKLKRALIYGASDSINLYRAEHLAGAQATHGDVFGDTGIGTTIKRMGASTTAVIRFGESPFNITNPVQTFGGGLRNLVADCANVAATGIRWAACALAEFINIKAANPIAAGAALLFTANPDPTLAPGGYFFDNTIRSCYFRNVRSFSTGTADGWRNLGNGTSGGGLTGCKFDMSYAEYNGNGNGFNFSAMDDCYFDGFFAVRIAGAGNHCLIDGDGIVGSGKQVSGNTWNMVHMGGNATEVIVATGAFCRQNYMYGVTGVDEAPTFIVNLGAELYYDFLGGPFGTEPNAVSHTPPFSLQNYNNTDPKVFDWYEQGTNSTPEIQFGGASVSVTYVARRLDWTRMGNRVFYNCTIALSSKGSSVGAVGITGLPFAANGGHNNPGEVHFEANMTAGVGTNHCTAIVPASAQLIQLWEMGAGGAPVQLTNVQFTNTSIVRVSGQYYVPST